MCAGQRLALTSGLSKWAESRISLAWIHKTSLSSHQICFDRELCNESSEPIDIQSNSKSAKVVVDESSGTSVEHKSLIDLKCLRGRWSRRNKSKHFKAIHENEEKIAFEMKVRARKVRKQIVDASMIDAHADCANKDSLWVVDNLGRLKLDRVTHLWRLERIESGIAPELFLHSNYEARKQSRSENESIQQSLKWTAKSTDAES